MSNGFTITFNGIVIGSVARYAGEPKGRQWVAYAKRKSLSDPELKESFLTKKAAVAWVEEKAKEFGYKYDW